jgi:hypothetical protein
LVVVLLGLGNALAREPGEVIRDRPSWSEQASAAVLPRLVDEDDASGDLASVLAPEIGVAQGDMPRADDGNDDNMSGGQWEIACEIKSGSALVFDRASLREYGSVTLFRWSAPRTRMASPGDQIFTALVNCREKTIEASWPGRSRETYAGTCGRGLVEAVCTAAEQASVGIPPSTRATPATTRASHHGGPLPRR